MSKFGCFLPIQPQLGRDKCLEASPFKGEISGTVAVDVRGTAELSCFLLTCLHLNTPFPFFPPHRPVTYTSLMHTLTHSLHYAYLT